MFCPNDYCCTSLVQKFLHLPPYKISVPFMEVLACSGWEDGAWHIGTLNYDCYLESHSTMRRQISGQGIHLTTTEINWEYVLTREHVLSKTKLPTPNYYLYSGSIYKLQMFYGQNRLEPDCKHFSFPQCTDPLAPWLHVFATQTAFNLSLKQQWVCKSVAHHLELCYFPKAASLQILADSLKCTKSMRSTNLTYGNMLAL